MIPAAKQMSPTGGCIEGVTGVTTGGVGGVNTGVGGVTTGPVPPPDTSPTLAHGFVGQKDPIQMSEHPLNVSCGPHPSFP